MNTNNRDEKRPLLKPDLLASLREIARAQGRDVQAVVDEALFMFIAGHGTNQPRQYVMDAYQSSHALYASLYRTLAQ